MATANGVRRKRGAAGGRAGTGGDYSLTLESIIGHTANHASALAVNPVSGELAFPAGCVAVVYSAKKHRQVRFFRASKGVSCVAYSRDGRYLAVGERGREPGAIVWDLSNGKIVADLKGHKYGVSCLAFSPKPRPGAAAGPPLLVTVGYRHDRTLLVWDVGSGARLAVARVLHKVHSLAWSEDGSFFVTCGERHIKFWPMTTANDPQSDLPPLAPPSAEVAEGVIPVLTGAAASIVDSHRSATFLDVACGRGRHRDSIYSVTSQGTLCVFSSRAFTMEQWMALETATAYAVTCTDDHVVVGCPDGLVRMFEADTLRYAATLPRPACLGPSRLPQSEHQYPAALGLRVLGPAARVGDDEDDGPQLLLAAVYADRSLMVWDVADLHAVSVVRACLGHSACIWDAQFIPYSPSDDSRRGWQAVGGEDGGEEVRLPGGALVTCSADDTIRFWSLGREVGPPLHTIHLDDEEQGGDVAGRGGGQLEPGLAPSERRALKAALLAARTALSEGSADTEIPSRPESKFSPRCLAMHPLGLELACGDKEGNLRVYDLTSTSAGLRSLKPAHDAEVLALDYSPGQAPEKEGGEVGVALLATGSRDRLVHVFDPTRNYARVQTLDNHSSSITAVRFSRDGRTLLSCGGDRALVMSSVDGRKVTRLKAVSVPSGTVYDIDVDPTNKYMITSGQDRRVNIWDVRSGKHMRSYRPEGPSGELYKVALDPSGMYAATCSFDKLVRIFDFFSGASLAKVSGHSEVVTAVRFSPDGRRLVSVGGDGVVFVWRLPVDMTQAMHDRLTELHSQPPPLLPRHTLPHPSTIRLVSSPPHRRLPQEAGRREEVVEEEQGSGGLLLKMRTSDLPAWARKDLSASSNNRGGGGDDVAPPPSRPASRWAARAEERGGLRELLGQVLGGERRKLTVEDLGEALRDEAVGGGGGGPSSPEGTVVIEEEEARPLGGEEEDEDLVVISQDEEDDEEEEAKLKAPGELQAVGEEERAAGRAMGLEALRGPMVAVESPVDECSRRAGCFSVNQSRDGGGLLVHVDASDDEEGEEEGGGGRGEAAFKRRDEEAAGWLRQALRDASPVDSTKAKAEGAGAPRHGQDDGGDDGVVRMSLSGSFLRDRGGKLRPPPQQHDEHKGEPQQLPPAHADQPPPPPPPFGLALRAQGPTVLPGGAVAVPPPSLTTGEDIGISSSSGGRAAEGPDTPPRTLEQEREALKVKQRKGRETVEKLQQMQDRLRQMGILRGGAQQQTGATSMDGSGSSGPTPSPSDKQLGRRPLAVMPPPPPEPGDAGSATAASKKPPDAVAGWQEEEGGGGRSSSSSAKATMMTAGGAKDEADGMLADDDFFDDDDTAPSSSSSSSAPTTSQPKTLLPSPPIATEAPVTAPLPPPPPPPAVQQRSGGLKSLFSPSFRSRAAAKEASSHAHQHQQGEGDKTPRLQQQPPPEALPPPPPSQQQLQQQQEAPPVRQDSAKPKEEEEVAAQEAEAQKRRAAARPGPQPAPVGDDEEEAAAVAADEAVPGPDLLSLTSPVTPRPLEVYYGALRELDGAARRAMTLYRELVEADKLARSGSPMAPPTTPHTSVASSVVVEGGLVDVLDCFRSSFASLGDAAHEVAAVSDEARPRSSSSSTTSSPSLSFTPRRDGDDASSSSHRSPAMGEQRAGSMMTTSASSQVPQQEAGAVVPAVMLERYSEMLLRLVERKVDDLLLTRSTSVSSSHAASPFAAFDAEQTGSSSSRPTGGR